MHHVINLDDLPARDRFEFWWEAVGRSVVPVHASSEQATDFWARMESVDLGSVQISRVRCVSFQARRTPQLIRRADPDLYQLSLTLRGQSGLQQDHRQASLAPNDLVLYDTSLPFHAWTIPDGRADPRLPGAGRAGRADGVILQFPRDLLAISRSSVRRLFARQLPGDTGLGALLATMLRQTLEQAAGLTSSDNGRLSTIVVDLITAVLAHELEADPACVPPLGREAMLLRVQAFILRHLGDPELSPKAIAIAHNISNRSLQRLFQAHDTTVTEWIRTQRLERCRRELTAPYHRHQPIHAIAARWGFPNPAHFSRAFRTSYGLGPQDYRRRWRNADVKDAQSP
jgi:AraC-like DNA-binding protein